MADDGPAYTVLHTEPLTDGRVRVLVRKRGGQRIRLCVPVELSSGPEITDLLDVIVEAWKPTPPPARP